MHSVSGIKRSRRGWSRIQHWVSFYHWSPSKGCRTPAAVHPLVLAIRADIAHKAVGTVVGHPWCPRRKLDNTSQRFHEHNKVNIEKQLEFYDSAIMSEHGEPLVHKLSSTGLPARRKCVLIQSVLLETTVVVKYPKTPLSLSRSWRPTKLSSELLCNEYLI